MNLENLVIIKGGTYDKVKQALRQWLDIYTDKLSDKMLFELYSMDDSTHVIKADPGLTNLYFFFLVNYMIYPEGMEKYDVEVTGYTVGHKGSKFENQKLLVYIPKDDKEYDNVYVITEGGQHFKVDFGGIVTEQSRKGDYIKPELMNLVAHEILKVQPEKLKAKKARSIQSNIEKRFKILAGIFTALALINFFTPSFTNDPAIQSKTTGFIGMGLGIWFFMDFEMLKSNLYYLKCLIISVSFLGYVIFFKSHYPDLGLFANWGALNPLSLLLLQWPGRKIYLAIFNREPEVDKQGKTADRVYTFLLFFSMVLLPFWITSIFPF